MSELNIYQKIMNVRSELLSVDIKKSGHNKFSNFYYYELKDFLGFTTRAFTKIGLYSRFSITPATNDTQEKATLVIVNCNAPSEIEVYELPTAECFIGMKKDGTGGADPIQNLGGKITYLRRYMYLIALDLIEDDQVDSKEQITRKPTYNEPQPRYNDEKTAIEDSTRIGLDKVMSALDKPENANYKRTVISTICKEQGVDSWNELTFTKDFTYKVLIIRVKDLIDELKKIESEGI